MIHHISIAVKNPLQVVNVLAEILNGKVFPFFPIPGSYFVAPFDEYGTGIAVCPLGTELIPGHDYTDLKQQTVTSEFVPFHAAISVTVSQEQIEYIANREGWIVDLCEHGSFRVIEFWVENRLLLEFLTPELLREYLDFCRLENVEKFFAQEASQDQTSAIAA